MGMDKRSDRRTGSGKVREWVAVSCKGRKRKRYVTGKSDKGAAGGGQANDSE